MIFFHKPYYNPNYTNHNKKSPNICLKPKQLYKLYKLYNAKLKNLKEHRKKLKNQNLKVFNYKYLLTGRKYFNNNQINTKPKEKICLLPLCDISNLIFSTIFEEDIECNYITSHMCKP